MFFGGDVIAGVCGESFYGFFRVEGLEFGFSVEVQSLKPVFVDYWRPVKL